MSHSLQTFSTLLANLDPRIETRIDWLHAPPPWVLFLVIIPVACLFLTWVYRSEKGSLTVGRRFLLGGIRLAILLSVIAALCEPILTTERLQRENSSIVIMVDDSYSMRIKDHYSDEQRKKLEELTHAPYSLDSTRLQLVNRLLNDPQLAFVNQLRKKANVKIVSFSDGVRKVAEFPRLEEDTEAESLNFDLSLRGKVTQIGDSIREAADSQQGDTLAGIVMFSDGRSNHGSFEPEKEAARLSRHEVPIYTVGVGNAEDPKDIRLFGLSLAKTVLVDDHIPVDFSIINEGFADKRVKVYLTLEEVNTGKRQRVSSKSIKLIGGKETQSARLEFRPTKEGRFRAIVEIEAQEGELLTDNNQDEQIVKVIDQKIKLLYVDGPPRWGYRFLTWSLTRDPAMEAHILLTSADYRWTPEASSTIEPISSFPTTREELFKYHVIIIGDVSPRYFSDKQKEWLVEFVDDLGGGLIFMAGEQAMPHAYSEDPLSKLFPVELEDSDVSSRLRDRFDTEFSLRLSPEGESHPIMQLVADPKLNKNMWQADGRVEDALPGFFWWSMVKRVRRGGVSLAVHPEREHISYGPRPLFAYQFHGRGRTFMSLVDETWRWRYYVGKKWHYRFWGQVIRFVSIGRLQGKSSRFSIDTDNQVYTLGQAIEVEARILNKEFKPTREPERLLHQQKLGTGEASSAGPAGTFEAIQVPARKDVYQATLEAKELGEHRLWIEDLDREVASTTYRVVVPQLEYAEPKMDQARLRRIADKSGGEYFDLHQLAELPKKLQAIEHETLIKADHSSLWDKPIWLILVIGLLAAEWILRKAFRLL